MLYILKTRLSREQLMFVLEGVKSPLSAKSMFRREPKEARFPPDDSGIKE